MREHQIRVPGTALPGRQEPLPDIPTTNVVLGTALDLPAGADTEVLYVAMGCFWGAERLFYRLEGVRSTAAGYQGGSTLNPTYREVCTGHTGHTEAVRIAYDPARISPEELLKVFWENHDPTTPDRQGNDVGTQYRSAVYWTTADQERAAWATHDAFQQVLTEAGHGTISTELASAEQAGPFYYAEDYHQQYLQKNPGGYCNHGPNGYSCPIGLVRQDELPSQESIAPSA